MLQDAQRGALIGLGIVLPIRKAGKVYSAARSHATKLQIAAGAVALKGAVGSAVRSQPWYFVPRDLALLIGYGAYKSRGGSIRPQSSQQVRRSGGPSAQKTRRAQGLLSRGRTKSGRERPWCVVHQAHHWFQFTR